MEGLRIFIVEDDPLYAGLLEYNISLNPDFEVERYTTGKECLANLYKKPSVITIDYSLPDMTGRELLKKIRHHDPSIAVIMISGQEDITVAVGLIKEGAFDYIVKDEETGSRLWNSLRLLQDNLKLRDENERLREEIGKKYDFSKTIIGNSPGIKQVFSLIEKAAASQIMVSVTGETGTGKELVAKAIHYHSDRKKHPFVAINIGALPKDLIESELFGYEKGAFTGAVTRKTGVFEDADRGTLFLDEIAEMDLNMQTRLLRVLQEKEIRRIGGHEDIRIDVRVITATHKNLAEEVKRGTFRTDLFYRLMGLPIHLMPLRERGSDILLLARHFADEFCRENKRHKVSFTAEATRKLMNYHYPGNIRELKAVVELAIILSDTGDIGEDNISFTPLAGASDIFSEEMTLDDYVVRIIKRYLDTYGHDPALVAKKLGIGRSTVYRYISNYNL